MKTKQAILIACVLIFFIAAGDILAYNDVSTHPKLTQKTALFFNQNYGQKLSQEEILWLGEGAKNEDTPPRWINHFYDPQTGLGWTSERMGNLSPEIVKLFSSMALSPENAVSSPKWAQNQDLQEKYAMYQGNRTFQKAVFDYANGDKKEAFKSLGHILHLIQDMTVPAHTRQDTHLQAAGDPGEPYESWAHDYAGFSHLDNLPKSGFGCSDLDDCFLKTAKYSNENFFSEDTINDLKYKKIVPGRKEIIGNYEKYYKQDKIGMSYLFLIKDTFENVYILNKPEIHSSYWSLLSKQAVYSGAEVIRIFFDQTEKAQKDKSILQPPPPSSIFSLLGTGIYAAGNKNKAVVSLYGEAAKIKDALSGIKDSVSAGFSQIGNALSNTFSGAKSLFSSIFSSGNSQPVLVVLNSPLAPVPTLAQTPIPTPSLVPKIVSTPKPSPVILPQNKTVAAIPLASPFADSGRGAESGVTEEFPQTQPPVVEETNPSKALIPSPTPASGGGYSSGSGSGTGGSAEDEEITIPETEIILGPNDVSTSSAAFFYFKASDEISVFECQIDGATSTPCVSPATYNGLAEGPHIFKVWAFNGAGLDETPAEQSWNINFAPEIKLEISGYEMTKIDFAVQWTSSSTDAAYFDIEFKIGSAGEWRSWLLNTTENSKPFQASFDDTIYHFRARAVDSAGIASEWVQGSALICQKPIVINEIMYNPGPTSADDHYYEYIEIYNRSPVDLDLTGWKFVSSPKEHNLESDRFFGSESMLLQAGGFALISDKISTSTAQNIYDGYYSVPETGSFALRLNIDDASMDLSNSGRKISIFNSFGEEMDSVSYFSYWGANGSGKSLERINPRSLYAQDRDSWAESLSEGGTPNAANSRLDETAGTVVDDHVIIAKNFIWPQSGSPYFLQSNARQYPTVNASTTLIIEAGTVLKPRGKFYYSLFVEGGIKAIGESGNPIVFTSASSTPQAGDWASGIYFSPKSSGSTFKNVIFEYGGSVLPWPNPKRAAIYIDRANVEFEDCVFRESQTHFLELIGSNSIVKSSNFASTTDYAIFIAGSSSPQILNSIFTNQNHKGEAIHIENQASPMIGQNTISGFEKAVFIRSSYPDIMANNIFDNSYNGAFIDDLSVFSRDAIFKKDIVYILEGSSGHNLRIATSTTLTIEPGTILKATHGAIALEVEGNLIAQGNSSSSLITFTSIEDDSLGGDTNNNGAESLPDLEAGEWIGLKFLAGSESNLDFVHIKYAGLSHTIYGDLKDPLVIFQIADGATVNLGNVTVE